MSDRRELDELSQRLLRSAASDRPTEEARRRTAMALGLTAPLPPSGAPAEGGAAGAGSNAALSAATQGGAGAAPLAAAASGLPAVPWVAKVVLGLALAAGASAPLWHVAVEAPSVEPSPLVPEPLTPPEVPAPVQVQAQAQAPEVPPTPPPPLPKVRRGARPAAPEPSTPPPTLAEETALLQRAHQAWSAKDLSAMDQALADYQRRCPKGRLSREAELLGLDRLWLAGDRPGFLAAAREFERRHPVPGLPPRLRAHLGGPP